MRSNHVCVINRSGTTKSEKQASIRGSRRTALGNRSRSCISPECQFVRPRETLKTGGGVSPAAPLGGMRQNEQVETGEQEQKEWGQRRVDDPGGSFPQSHGGEV